MPPEPTITETGKSFAPHLTVRPLYLALLAPFIIAGLLYTFMPSLREGLGMLMVPAEDTLLDQGDESTEYREPEGTIFLSLTPMTESTIAHRSLYTLDVTTGALTELIADPTTDYFEPTLNRTGDMIALVTSPSDATEEALFYGDTEFNDLTKASLPKDVTYLRSPSFSPDSTKIAFVGAGKEVTTFATITGQDVYLHTIEGNTTTRIAEDAVSPVFTTDGRLMVLKADGIHVIDLSTNTDTILIPQDDTPFTGADQFALSPDDRTLALSLPSRRTTLIFTLEGDTPTLTMTYDVGTTEPTFSPDGSSLAALTYDEVETNGTYENQNYRLVTFGMTENASNQALMSLSNYYPGLTALGGWK